MNSLTRKISKILGFSEQQCNDDRPIWVFGEWLGSGKYCDNSKCLFEYVSTHHTEIRAIWLTKNMDNLAQVRSKSYEAYFTNSIKGFWVTLLSKAGFLTHHPRTDLNPICLLNGSNLVQLFHGIPLKKIAFDHNDFVFNKKPYRSLYIWLRTKFLANFAIVTVSSEENQKTFGSAFMTQKEKIKITGCPRNDLMFQDGHNSDKKFRIIYMPTYRESIDSNNKLFEEFERNIKGIDKFLASKNMSLYLRIHPFRLPPVEFFKKIEQTANIISFQENDIYETLNQFDLLITDYSSIYLDYLLLNRPIIFSPFDLEDYLKSDREMYYDYADVTPGPKTRNWDEIVTEIEKISSGNDNHREERERVCNMFHKYRDGNSCERVCQEVFKLNKLRKRC